MSEINDIKLKKGLGTVEKPAIENGSILIETDSGRMFIDDNDVRIQIGRRITEGDTLPESGVEGDVFLLSGEDNGNEDAYSTLYPVVNEHVNNVDNPHNVTWEQVGAAPGNLGWGDVTGGPSVNDLNQAVLPGFYTAHGVDTVNAPGNMVYAPFMVMRRNNYIYQKATNIDGYNGVTEIMRASRDGGATWTEWEWVNPPMVLGVEYRTTERWNGRPIYTATFDCGAMPNNALKMFNYRNALGIVPSEIIKCTGHLSTGTVLPLYVSDGERATIYANNYEIVVRTWYNYSPYTFTAQIWYVK